MLQICLQYYQQKTNQVGYITVIAQGSVYCHKCLALCYNCDKLVLTN